MKKLTTILGALCFVATLLTPCAVANNGIKSNDEDGILLAVYQKMKMTKEKTEAELKEISETSKYERIQNNLQRTAELQEKLADEANTQNPTPLAASQTSSISFSNSEKVYCFKYVKRVNDGITSKSTTPDYIFVNFQKDMVGIYEAGSSIQTIRQNLLENPDYYNQKAIEDLVNRYNKWDSAPVWKPSWGSGAPSAVIYKYNTKYSTTNKKTYQNYCKNTHYDMNFQYNPYNMNNTPQGTVDSWGYIHGSWDKPKWGRECYTFSYDGELIIWSTSNVEDKKYYQLIDVNELQPNMDFLF